MVSETTASLDFFFDFKKRFTNLCRNTPIYLQLEFLNASVGVKNLTTEEVVEFAFDTTITPVENIARIKTWMQDHWYPYLEEEIVDTQAPSTAEILKRSRAGEDVDKLLTEKIEVKRTVRWIIERVNDKNEIVLTNQSEPWLQSIYRLNAPSINFINRLVKKELSPIDGWIELQEPMIARHCYDFDKRAKRKDDETVSGDSD